MWNKFFSRISVVWRFLEGKWYYQEKSIFQQITSSCIQILKRIFITFDHLWVKLFGFLQCILGVQDVCTRIESRETSCLLWQWRYMKKCYLIFLRIKKFVMLSRTCILSLFPWTSFINNKTRIFFKLVIAIHRKRWSETPADSRTIKSLNGGRSSRNISPKKYPFSWTSNLAVPTTLFLRFFRHFFFCNSLSHYRHSWSSCNTWNRDWRKSTELRRWVTIGSRRVNVSSMSNVFRAFVSSISRFVRDRLRISKRGPRQ